MSLPETVDFDKNGEVQRTSRVRQVFLGLVVVLVALLSFGLGKLSVGERNQPVIIEANSQFPILNLQTSSNENSKLKIDNLAQTASVYASSKGKKYYYPWCKSTVSEANKVTFASPNMAESAGYTLASNCLPR